MLLNCSKHHSAAGRKRRDTAATVLFTAAVLPCLAALAAAPGQQPRDNAEPNYRPPKNENDLRFWLENMVWYHRFSIAEIQAATGMSQDDIKHDLERLNIRADNRPAIPEHGPLIVLPYPGGRHPRIGFLEGAIRPQRETKVSIFTPWDPSSYVVADVPEAIWSNLGLTYLAHTHVPTIWTKQNVELDRLEWERLSDGTLRMTRRLPNGIAFGTKVTARPREVLIEQWLSNGTDQTLSDLRVQNCVMLKGASEFAGQTNDNKLLRQPFVACHNSAGDRWVVVAWSHCHRAWANERCPCMHSDPQFPDCGPGETQQIRGWISFYQGTDVNREFQRIEASGWLESSGQ